MMAPEDVAPTSGWATASLRIVSDTVGTDSISEQLGLKPTSTRTAEGEPAFAVWMLESELAPSSPLEDHLYILLAKLRDRLDALAELSRSANIEMWLGYSPAVGGHRSAIFGHEALAELGELGIDLVFDPYPAGLSRPVRETTD
jgi:hypothetical protein